MPGKSRIAEAYFQLIPVIDELWETISQEVRKGYEDAGKKMPKLPVPETDENANQKEGKKGAAAWGKGFIAGAAALGLGAIVAGQISTGLDNQKTNSKVAAALALTGTQAKVVQASIKGLYANGMGESYEEVADAMKSIVGTISSAKDASQSELEGMGRDVLNLSSTFGVGSDEITKAAESAIQNGLVSNFGQANSLILAGFQSLGDKGDDWLDTLNEFSDDFKRFGFTGNEALNLVQAGIKAGIKDTDALADSLNELSIRINDGTAAPYLQALGLDPKQIQDEVNAGGKTAQDAFKKVLGAIQSANKSGATLTIGAGDAAEQINAATAAANIFGSRAEDYLQPFMNLDLSNVSSQLKGVTGDTDAFAKTLNDNASTSLASFSRAFQDSFQSVVIPLLEAVTPPLQAVATFLQENSGAATALGIVIGGIFLGAIVLSTVALWGMAAAGFAAMVPFLPLIAVILAVVAVIGAVIAISWLLMENWDTINDAIAHAWDVTVGAIVDSVKWLMGVIGDFFGFVGQSLNIGFNSTTPTGQSYGMATGGTVAPSPGGTAVRLAEAGRPETVVDTGNVNQLIDMTLKQGGSSDGPKEINVYQLPGETTDQLVARLADYWDFNDTRGGN